MGALGLLVGVAFGLAAGGAPAGADLVATLAASPSPALVGRDLTYLTTAANLGSGEAAGVTVEVEFRPRTSVKTVTVRTPGVSCAATGTKITCLLGSIAAGRSKSVALTVRPAAPGSLGATARISSSTADPNLSNNSADTETIVNVPPPPLRLRFLLVDRRPKTPRAGDKFFVNLQVVRSDTGGFLGDGKVSCSAAIGGRKVPLLVRDSYPVPTCLWRIPFGTARKTLRIVIGVRFRGISISRRLALEIR